MRGIVPAAVLATFAVTAMAAFKDADPQPKGPIEIVVVSPRVSVATAYNLPTWGQVVSPQTEAVPLAAALAMILPSDLPAMGVMLDRSQEDRLVSWPAGLARKDAMSLIVPVGFALRISEGKLIVGTDPSAGTLAIASAIAQVPVQAARAGAKGSSDGAYFVVETKPMGTSAPGQHPQGAAAPVATKFEALKTDQNLRKVIDRWAPLAGWSFENSYWTLDRDIPVSGSAPFSSDFKASVLALLKTTEVSDRPAKPCFYTNMVVRVVSKSEKCDKTKE